MSTIPFTLIEGSMALPRMRPLGRHFPAPFGRDWAYRPPGHSLRIELKALYAAVVHTFCMSDQTFRSFCKWVPPMPAEPREVSAGARTQPREEPATSGQAPLDRTAKFSVEARSLPSARRPAVAAPSQPPSGQRNALAGGACALSGAALLAWIVLSHAPHPHAIGESSRMQTTAVDRGAPPTQSEPASAVAAPTVGQVGSVRAPDVASSPVNVAVDSGNAHEQRRHGNAKPVASYKPALAAVGSDRVPSVAGSTIATQGLPHPSGAGSYAPLAAAQSDRGRYASVTMSAATPVRAISQPPRSASAAAASVAGETEWMSRLSQRRVTEIPDQFSK